MSIMSAQMQDMQAMMKDFNTGCPMGGGAGGPGMMGGGMHGGPVMAGHVRDAWTSSYSSQIAGGSCVLAGAISGGNA